jgi:hypothetical protein
MLLTDAIRQSNFQQGSLLHMRSRAFEAVAPNAVAGGSGYLISKTASMDMSAEQENEETLSLFLYLSASCDTTDMRDKVYGMLAILDSVFGGIIIPPVDYSKTLPRVFEDFTVAMIRSTGTLWPLESIAHSRAEDLPSWVPDLRDPTAVSMTWHWSGLKRRIPHRAMVDMADPSKPGCLPVRARFLDKVIQVYERMPIFRGMSNDDGTVDAERAECLSAWTAVAAALDHQVSDDYDAYTEALPKLTPFLKYLRKRHDPSQPQQPPVTRDPDPPFLQRALGLDPDTSLLRAAFGLKKDKLRGATTLRFDDQYDGAALFLTKNSLIGLCKGDVRDGDCICQLARARYPTILRRVGHLEEFQFVGITDVNGLDAQHLERSMQWQESALPEDELKNITLY